VERQPHISTATLRGARAVGIVCAGAGAAAITTVAIAIDTIDVRFTLSSLLK